MERFRWSHVPAAAVAVIAGLALCFYLFPVGRIWFAGAAVGVVVFAVYALLVRRRPERRAGPGETRQAGDPPPAAGREAAAKVARNDPCPCGSGEKYKRCCGLSGG